MCCHFLYRGSSCPTDQTYISRVFCISGGFLEIGKCSKSGLLIIFQKAESHTASHPSHSVSSSKSQIQPRVPKVTQLMHFRVEIQIPDIDSRAFSTRKSFMQLSLQDHFFFGMGAAAGGAPQCACSLAPPARSRKGERSRPRPVLAGASALAAILASRGKAV